MAANVSPIHSGTPRIDSAKMNTLGAGAVVGPNANTAQDGSGANSYICFVAGANGSFIQKVSFRPIGSPNASVGRVFMCNNLGAFPGTWTAGTTNTAANSTLLGEVSLPATTLSQTNQAASFDLPLGFPIPSGCGIFVTFGSTTGSAGTGYDPFVVAGNY